MRKLLIPILFSTIFFCCNKKSDPAPIKSDTTAYFLEWDVPPNTELTTVVDGEVIVDSPINGQSSSFQTINKFQVISYSATNPINIRVHERILTNYQGGQVYITINNTTSGTLDFSSLPK